MQENINVNSKIINRVLKFIKLKSISVNQFHKEIGVGNGYLAKVKSISSDIIESISEHYPEVNLDWLITGKGDMLKPNINNVVKVVNNGIPLLTEAAFAGVTSGDVSILELECERYVIPTFKGADFLITVKGSSMTPKYSSGDIVACKWLPLDTFFQWNKVYVLDTIQGPLIKRICEGKDIDHLKIVSENEKYPSYHLHKSEIRKLAIVIGVIRLE